MLNMVKAQNSPNIRVVHIFLVMSKTAPCCFAENKHFALRAVNRDAELCPYVIVSSH